jgi:hypothetical protein
MSPTDRIEICLKSSRLPSAAHNRVATSALRSSVKISAGCSSSDAEESRPLVRAAEKGWPIN